MYILGIHGNVHDSSACLLENGKIVAAAEEERFVRIKHADGYPPSFASRYCLNHAGIQLEDIDYVVTSFMPERKNGLIIYNRTESNARFKDLFLSFFPDRLFHCKQFPMLAHVDHHSAHAASAFYCSGFPEASIIVVDGRGEFASTTLAHGIGNDINILRSYDISQSLGIFYSAISHYVGLGGYGEGKTMALAAFGNPNGKIPCVRILRDGYEMEIPPGVCRTDEESPSNDCGTDLSHFWMQNLIENFGPPNLPHSDWSNSDGTKINRTQFEQNYLDIAASAQRDLEEIVLILAKEVIRQTNCKNLVLAGGVALNCSMNGRLAEAGIADRIFIQPAANDAGTSLGAALELSARLNKSVSQQMHTVALGPEFSDNQIRKIMQEVGLDYQESSSLSEAVAQLLAEKKIVGWFQGRMEFGPRALGQRSILANPEVDGMKDHLNHCVKHRESFRPYALSLRIEDCEEVFDSWSFSPHMLLSFKVKKYCLKRISAGVHVDGTTRPQMVCREQLPLYWDMLGCFKKLTGIPAVLNTSFNDEGEPIVCTPLDALRAFYSTPLHALVLGPFLIRKKHKD